MSWLGETVCGILMLNQGALVPHLMNISFITVVI